MAATCDRTSLPQRASYLTLNCLRGLQFMEPGLQLDLGQMDPPMAALTPMQPEVDHHLVPVWMVVLCSWQQVCRPCNLGATPWLQQSRLLRTLATFNQSRVVNLL